MELSIERKNDNIEVFLLHKEKTKKTIRLSEKDSKDFKYYLAKAREFYKKKIKESQMIRYLFELGKQSITKEECEKELEPKQKAFFDSIKEDNNPKKEEIFKISDLFFIKKGIRVLKEIENDNESPLFYFPTIKSHIYRKLKDF